MNDVNLEAISCPMKMKRGVFHTTGSFIKEEIGLILMEMKWNIY